MKIFSWLKNNLLILILVVIVVLLAIVKINSNRHENKNINLISPTPTVKLTPIIEQKIGDKTREEILQLEPEERYEFITNLNTNEAEKLDMMSNYDFSDFLPYKGKTFVAENYLNNDRTLTVTGLIEDKEKMLDEINGWLFYEMGNNPRTIKIIWK